MENKEKIIEKLFPEVLPTLDEIEEKYPQRKLKEGAMVTRIAPSPTGFMHIGSLYTALISERLAHQTDGIFFLRIEDTDKKREVEGASKLITKSLDYYNIKTDEGENASGEEVGKYGPYKQSERADIYKAYIRHLLEKGLAYPCFSTSEELEEMHKKQEEEGIRPGYYSNWAIWRNKSEEEVLEALEQKKPFVIRFKSNGNFENKILIEDVLLGKKELSENDQDIVIMKSDGLPTYHMAHIVDDHLMRTTHVVRGNEWLSSLPLHLQLFRAMEWKAPKYGHIFPIQKMEGSSKRKLSKRKDPEANVDFFKEQGYPKNAIIEYLLNLANSNFEDWRKQNPDKDNKEFVLTLKKLASSNGPLFDFVKLDNISKEIISKYTAEEVYNETLNWAKKYDLPFAEKIEKHSDYVKKILGIERGNNTKARKDISKWSNVKAEIEYFFDEDFSINKEEIKELLWGIDNIDPIIKSFLNSYNEKDNREEWFEKIKEIGKENGFAEDMKKYKESPENYKGNVADVAKIFRVLLTGKTQTPDLYSIIQVMGKERVFNRLKISGESGI
ncbi:MAG: glutamate--tRNA ligase [Candidatus Pacebacteria bacterium]|nr:glutamate--tRNA ligase [Candidatus Paceibacterota bacterium]